MRRKPLAKLGCVIIKRSRGKEDVLEWLVIENKGRKEDVNSGVEAPVVVPGAP